MREIKFRAWHKDEKFMSPITKLWWDMGNQRRMPATRLGGDYSTSKTQGVFRLTSFNHITKKKKEGWLYE